METPAPEEDASLLRALRGSSSGAPTYQLTRFVSLRAIGFIYVVAFSILCNQMLPLFGSHGLEPAPAFIAGLHQYSSFWKVPGLFWFDPSDRALTIGADVGLALSILVMLGIENAFVMFALWLLYLSFVHVGQTFYGYGWETLLLEAGFLSIFLCPCTHVLPLHDPTRAPKLV
ncbi:MAG TPA: lipase maturation factor family protein, partial [Polyangiales bacterium]|nr:lipase maturation factor family protein [Polyangiales bacterium]